jgi:hypothetical protein
LNRPPNKQRPFISNLFQSIFSDPTKVILFHSLPFQSTGVSGVSAGSSTIGFDAGLDFDSNFCRLIERINRNAVSFLIRDLNVIASE